MGKRLAKPKIDEDVLGLNPLVDADFHIWVRRIIDSKKLKLEGDILVPVEIELEQQEYVKVYMSADNRKVVGLLSKKAKSLLFWILYRLESGKDYIWINRRQYMEDCFVSSYNTYKSAVRELIRCNILCFSVIRDVYWINPRFFFNGSRVNKYPLKVKDYREK